MDDPDPGSSIISSLILILVLTLVNAFLAGAEMAFVALNHSKIHQLAKEGDKRARRVQRLLAQPDAFLSAIQVGITFAGFLNSASASQAFVGLVAPSLGSTPLAWTLANLIVTLAISYVSLVLGELYPKQLALQIPETYARMSAGVILFLRTAFKPFIWLLTFSVGLLKKLTPLDFTMKEEKLTREQMKVLLSSSHSDGAIDADELDMMRGVLSLDTRLVREIMVPRVDTDMLDSEDDFETNYSHLISQLRSRLPLYEDDKDHILGIIHLKDVLLNLEALKNGQIQLRDISRPALFVPDTMYTDELLLQFQKSKQHLAILVDEFGGVVGIVTLEDLIEEIVGDIRDEYDVEEEEEEIRMTGEKDAILLGGLSITDFNRIFQQDVQSEGADTIAGFIIEQLGFIPKPGEHPEVQRPGFTLKVLDTQGTRVESVALHLHEVPAEEATDQDEE